MNGFVSTFVAATRSVGTAATMAAAGMYLHRKGLVTNDGKRLLALLSQQLTIPAFLFTKIVYCEQDSSLQSCTSVTDRLDDIWIMLLWPLYVVGCGLLVGHFAARISNTPPHQRNSVMAACGFANSTGLPITLLTVVRANFPKTTDLGTTDPTLFLSIYLLLFPVLQWGVGGWLLSSGDVHSSVIDDHQSAEQQTDNAMTRATSAYCLPGMLDARSHSLRASSLQLGCNAHEWITDQNNHQTEQTPLKAVLPNNDYEKQPSSGYGILVQPPSKFAQDLASLLTTIRTIAAHSLQPPVIASLLGLLVASIRPVRGIFVDLVDRHDNAPMQWFFDGLYEVGRAAIPINMMILGINLDKAFQSSNAAHHSKAAQFNESDAELFSTKTTVAVTIGKLVLMPVIGIVSVMVIRTYLWTVPQSIDASFYLVMMIVFITPTANNVMVIVELSSTGLKEGVARLIGWQYAVAPFVLSLSVAVVVLIATAT